MTRHIGGLRLTDDNPESHSERIDADLLIPGRGDPISNGTVIFRDGKIEYAGPQKDVPIQYISTQTRATKVPVLMPGLWDCHCHFLGLSSLNLDDFALAPQALAGARCVRDVAATLNAGFTSVREVMGYGYQLAKAISEGWIPGPTIYSSVSALSQTAGHGDLHSMPLSLIHNRIEAGVPLGLCDGVDGCVRKVREVIRQGAQVIKICTSGGVLSIIDSPQAPQFSPAEIKAMVEEAARTDMIVAAHAHGKQGIINALEAGVKTIEHGSYLDEEAIKLMIEKDAILVATRTIVEHGSRNLDELQPEPRRKMQEISAAHKRAYAAAVKAGVRCALGTDLGISSTATTLRHGMNGQEFYWATVAGMTALEAIEAGTAMGPATLGPRGPKSGQLKEGYDADFIGLEESPVEDVKVLADPEKVKWVWKAGRLYKSPGKALTMFV